MPHVDDSLTLISYNDDIQLHSSDLDFRWSCLLT